MSYVTYPICFTVKCMFFAVRVDALLVFCTKEWHVLSGHQCLTKSYTWNANYAKVNWVKCNFSQAFIRKKKHNTNSKNSKTKLQLVNKLGLKKKCDILSFLVFLVSRISFSPNKSPNEISPIWKKYWQMKTLLHVVNI